MAIPKEKMARLERGDTIYIVGLDGRACGPLEIDAIDLDSEFVKTSQGRIGFTDLKMEQGSETWKKANISDLSH